ncbi:MAG: FAD-dependent oxidoreductase [Pseudomonadota bacterium]
MTYAIIGAGLAGLSAANALSERGGAVVVFDKGRGPGGRMSSRRAETPFGQMRFDHGVSYFTAEDRRFRSWLEDMGHEGVVAPWTGRFVSINDTGTQAPLAGETHWVGVPRMNALIRRMAEDHHVHWSTQITGLQSTDEGWHLSSTEGQTYGPFKRVIVAVPAEQAALLLATVHEDLAKLAARARSRPCWSVMLAFGEPVSADWDGALIETGPLHWCSRERSKPDRERAEAWVLHASRDWSIENLERTPEEVGDLLVKCFRDLTGAPEPGFVSAHRWRYAQPEVSSPAPYIWDDDYTLGLCGDWCGGGMIEAAWLSGLSIVQALGE